MNLNEIDKNLQNEFTMKKIHAESTAVKNLNLARSNPVFKKLEVLERETNFELGKENFEKTNKNNVKELQTALGEIKKLKLEVLQKLNLSLDDLKPKYDCEKCKDSGIFNGSVCSCYTKRRNQEIIKQYGLDKENSFSFSDLDKTLFKDETQLSEYIKLMSILEKWCEHYPNINKNSIVINGKTGVGKTFLIKCMAKRLIERNISVCFVTAFQMNELMLRFHTTFDVSKEQNLTPLIESDVLFIDDLGSEPLINNVTLNYLYNIISEREEKHFSTIITTNLNENDIYSRYEDRICSRLFNKKNNLFYNLNGYDLRQTKIK